MRWDEEIPSISWTTAAASAFQTLMLGILAGIDVGFWLVGTVCLAGCWESKSNNTRHQEWIWIKKISLSLSYKLKLGLKRIGSKFIIIKQCVVWMLVFLCESRNWDWLHTYKSTSTQLVFFVQSDYCSGMSLNSSSWIEPALYHLLWWRGLHSIILKIHLSSNNHFN